MARVLTNAMREVMFSERVMPQFVIEIYDIRSGENSVRDIIIGNTLSTTTGPRNMTADVQSATVTETAGDFSANGIGSTALTMQFKTTSDLFSNNALLADPTGDARWLRRGNFVRVYEGDAQVDFSEWPITFSGVLIGTVGFSETRLSGGDRFYTMQAVGREVGFLKNNRTSDQFLAGTSYNAMATDIALTDMGLDADEVSFSNWGSTTSNLSQQLVDQSPLVSIAQIMFTDGLSPRFNGEGILTDTSGLVTQPSVWVYEDDTMIGNIEQPFTNVNPPNVVIVVGLNNELTEVTHPRQVVATLNITTGYFTSGESNDVFWRDDHRLLARNVTLMVRKAVSGGIARLFGFPEKMALIPSVEGFGSLPGVSIGANLTVGTGFVSWVLVSLAVAYLAASYIPDTVVAFGGGATVPVGRPIQAAILIQILLIMSRIGRGVYDFMGDPFEYVYAEISGEARVANISVEDEVLLEIENHLLGSQAIVNAAARDVLFRKQAENHPRTLTMRRDLYLEIDDVFELPGDRKFLITSISRTLAREASSGFMSVGALEITDGLQA